MEEVLQASGSKCGGEIKETLDVPIYEITVSVKQNGVEVFGAPVRRRLEVDEGLGPIRYERATGGGYVSLPITVLDEVQFLLVRTDQQVTLRLDAQSDAGLVLNAGALLLILDADMDAGASTNATLDNSSGNTANIDVIAGGT